MITKTKRIQEMRAAARQIKHIADCHSIHQMGSLEKSIKQMEKQHRKLAPHGHSHRSSIPTVVDYFIIRTLANAARWYQEDDPVKLRSSIAGVREDYLIAISLMGMHRLLFASKGFDLDRLTALSELVEYCEDLT